MATAPSGHRSSFRGLLARLSLLAASSAIALLALEAGLRLLSPGYSPLFLDIYRIEDDGQVGLIPERERRHTSAEWSVDVDINQEGLRDYPGPRPPGTNVLAIGDSFTFGWGVELEDAFPSVLERHLKSARINVVKAGMPGTGTTDQLEWLRRHGDRYDPRLVLLGFYVGNDFVDVQLGGVPAQFTVRDGLMVKKPLDDKPDPTSREIVEWLKGHSLLMQQVAQVAWAMERRRRPEDRPNPGLTAGDRWLWEFFKIYLKNLPPETDKAVRLTLDALNGMHAWAQDHRSQFAIVVIPEALQTYDWQRRRILDAYHLGESDLDLDRPQRVLRDWGVAAGVPVLDLLPGFRAYAAAHEERLYFYPNGHMNSNGHRVAGEIITPFVQRVLTARASADPASAAIAGVGSR